MDKIVMFEDLESTEISLYKNDGCIGNISFWKDKYDNVPTINHFSIDDDERRKGHGTKLLKLMLFRLKEQGHKQVRILIGDKEDKAIRIFLTKFNFVNIRTSEQYMSMEADVLLNWHH